MEVLDKVKIRCMINQKQNGKQHGYNSRQTSTRIH
jgi:hypothetical protein